MQESKIQVHFASILKKKPSVANLKQAFPLLVQFQRACNFVFAAVQVRGAVQEREPDAVDGGAIAGNAENAFRVQAFRRKRRRRKVSDLIPRLPAYSSLQCNSTPGA